MPILELKPNPPRLNDRSQESDTSSADAASTTPAPGNLKPLRSSQAPVQPMRLKASRWGDLEEHELIHLLDAIDDERARAQFRESVYISTIICLAIAWFLFYGPHVIFHQPYYRDPIALMKEHDKQELTYIAPRAPIMKVAPKIDRKTMEALRKTAPKLPPLPTPAPPTPQPPVQQQPPEQAHNTAPPVPTPQLPLPAAPKPSPALDAPMPSAPAPRIAQNSQSAHDAIASAMRGALSARGGGDIPASPGAAGPLQAGTQILSDTQGVDFSAYMRQLHHDIQRNWDPLIPQEVEPPLMKKGIVGIRFSILPDGSIGEPMVLETTSGDVALDKAAWYAITSEGQFPPLPRAFHGPLLELRVGFFYNQPIQ